MKRFRVALGASAVGLLCFQVPDTLQAQSGLAWAQWAQNQEHTGFLGVAGQNLNRNLVNLIYDPLVPDEMAGAGGDLLVHYQTPLVDGNDVFMMSKSGTYSDVDYSTQRWHQDKFTWSGGTLTKVWTFDTDWVPPGSSNDFWEPVYHAVLANGFLYSPGAGGTIFKVDRATGAVVSRINPFDAIDANTFTVSPLSADAAGNIYYNVVQVVASLDFYGSDVVASWLVKVGADDSIKKKNYNALLSQATIIGDPVPRANDDCKAQFSGRLLPWPPPPNPDGSLAVPPTTKCGRQRAALNVAPAIGPDGTIYTVSRGHFVTRYNYLIAVTPDLKGKWAASLRGHLMDGCNDGTVAGSIMPKNGTPGGCRVGATNGFDPGTNEPGPGRVLDDASSTPTVAPDGSIFFGAYTRYNYAQGHLMHFSATGEFLNAFNFGWDSTPAIYLHDYSGLGSYCNSRSSGTVTGPCPTNRSATNPGSPEAFYVTQLSPLLLPEWSFKNTNKDSCARNPDNTVTCTLNTHPNSFEWCVNAPVVDLNGVVYANSEDGFLYAINQGGAKKASIFQQLNLGAAYTPASLGSDGKIYSQNAGHMFVVGN